MYLYTHTEDTIAIKQIILSSAVQRISLKLLNKLEKINYLHYMTIVNGLTSFDMPFVYVIREISNII